MNWDFEYRYEDYRPAIRLALDEHMRRRGQAQTMPLVAVGLLLMLGASVLLGLWVKWAFVLSVLPVLLAVKMLGPYWWMKRESTIARLWADSAFNGQPVKIEMGDERLTVGTPAQKMHIEWNAFLKFEERDGLFVLFHPQPAVYFLPKRVMTAEEVDAVRAALRGRVASMG